MLYSNLSTKFVTFISYSYWDQRVHTNRLSEFALYVIKL